MTDAISTISTKINALLDDQYNEVKNTEKGKLCIKDLTRTSSNTLDPINPHESEIQALRYYYGMLLIADSSADERKKILTKRAHVAFQEYSRLMHDEPDNALLHARWLIEQFALAIVQPGVDKQHARKQMTMAKDLGILLEEHADILTLSQNNGKITREKTSQIRIQSDYYDQHFTNLPEQKWYQQAVKHAGLIKAEDNWLETFFRTHLNELKSHGVPTTPSARWLPLPASNQIISIQSGDLQTQFIRTGTVAAYDISDANEQFKLAVAQMKEIILPRLANAIEAYKKLYAEILSSEAGAKFNFYIDYQTFLSPQFAETYLPHKDNNGKFVALTKKALAALEKDEQVLALANEHGANLIFSHTNSAINRFASLPTARNRYTDDDKHRKIKIAETDKLTNGIDKPILNPALKREIEFRAMANEYLKNALHSTTESTYQHNIMIAALECLAMGSQAFAIVGCKSARDRTAIFIATVKTMIENPDAMHDWQLLEKGIITSLLQGHSFRSMQHHCGIVKVDIVHKHFMEQFSAKVQADIKSLQFFANEAREFSEKEVDRHLFFGSGKAKHAKADDEKIMQFKSCV